MDSTAGRFCFFSPGVPIPKVYRCVDSSVNPAMKSRYFFQKSLPFVYEFVDKRNPLVYNNVDNNGSDEMTILELGKLTDAEARQYLENLLLPNVPICPHC